VAYAVGNGDACPPVHTARGAVEFGAAALLRKARIGKYLDTDAGPGRGRCQQDSSNFNALSVTGWPSSLATLTDLWL
jgi:hypothetical protein